MTQRMIIPKERYSEFIVVNYCQFALEKFGNTIWTKIAYTKINSENMIDLILEFGDVMMRKLIDLTSKYASIPVFEIIEDFSKYYEIKKEENRTRRRPTHLATIYC